MYKTETYNGFDVIVTYGCVTVYNSCLTTNRKKIENTLKQIAKEHNEDCIVFKKRSIKQLANEWIAHTRLYNLGIKKDHTQDVDLEYPQKKIYSIAYAILGI